MQLRLSGPRSIAMATVAGLFGWWLTGNQAVEVAHYRTLSRDALLAEVTQARNGDMLTNLLGAILLVGMVVFAVDLLTEFYGVIWARIAGAPVPEKPHDPVP